MATITHLNFSTTLKQSTNPRGSAPNGNVYFDLPGNKIQLIGADELPTVDFGAGAVTNPLNRADGITMRAMYNFENQERRLDENMRRYRRGTDGDYRFAGAFSFVNGVTLYDNGTTTNDRELIRESGFIEYANLLDGATRVNRIYHGVKSLNPIQSTTVSRYALVADTNEATLQSATWYDFVRTGSINEVIQVFGTTDWGDTTSFDDTESILVVRVRSWRYVPGETTSVLTGVLEFSGFSAGYGVGETLNPQNSYNLSDVYGGARIAPYTGMKLKKLAVAQTATGFTSGSANFTWVLENTGGVPGIAGTVQQCAAYLDAAALQDADIEETLSYSYNGVKGRVWYTRDSNGKVVTTSTGGAGLFIENLSTSEKQNIIMTDDTGTQRVYPYFTEIQIIVGSAAVADTNAWFHAFYTNGVDTGGGEPDYDTALAVTVNDSNNQPVKGNVSSVAVSEKITFSYAYDTNTQAGLGSGAPKDITFLVEGDGVGAIGAGQASTNFTITRVPVITVTCAPPTDTNA